MYKTLFPALCVLFHTDPLTLSLFFLGVFRECGGARCAHNMVPYPVCRQQALTIVQQLVLSQGGDDDMGTLLGLMHTAPPTELTLKTHILKVSVIFSVVSQTHILEQSNILELSQSHILKVTGAELTLKLT